MGKHSIRHGEAFGSASGPLGRWLERAREKMRTERLEGALALLMVVVAVVPIAWLLATLELKWGIVAFLVLIGIPLLVFCLFDIVFALGLMLVTALLVVFGAKYTSAPIGTLLDLLILVSGVGILLRQLQERDWSFARYGLSYIIVLWLGYNFLQVLNPEAGSRLAWLYTVRSVAIQQVVFFIGAYALRRREKGIYALLGLIVLLCFASALYGLKQRFLGFSAQETSWIIADRERSQLYYQWGMMRIPSFCYDPTTFGILMACFSVFCAALIAGPTRPAHKLLLGCMLVCALWVMAYTGTRTAYALVPVGGIFLGGLILNRKVALVGLFLALAGTVFILKPSSSGVVYRIQSAFKPSKDASMNLRLTNQKRIQPYIQSHPIGGGLGSSGVWGRRFNPGTDLANFPHDSSFVRMGVELGWIGLILYTIFHYIVLRTGLYYFVRCRDPWIKAVYAGVTAWCFMLAVACYVQEAILQQPMNVIYNVLLAVLVTLKNFDPAFRQDAD